MANLIDNEVLQAFITYATIVTLKMLLMAPWTAYFRITRKAFANPEDAAHGKTPEDKKKMLKTDPDVERVRRCHQNDLESVVPFVLIGLLYALTGPDLSTALLHFRVFVVCRFIHTVAYVFALPQPSRGLPFIVGLITTLSMGYRILNSVMLL
ncbi:microsomal glutathione S-transferase 1-like [Sardina pilchardus]|uniref:microsomal glutathione S-transferase 1-like n=1 Tax=Sardina pilchardus TaxID=27697 RepID=UPI002E14FF73